MKQVQRRIWVTGRVQGVGFRAFTVRQAGAFPGLKGFVRNLSDGRVEAVFSGEENAVSAMIEACRKGPRFSKVTEWVVKEEPVDLGLPEFGVVHN